MNLATTLSTGLLLLAVVASAAPAAPRLALLGAGPSNAFLPAAAELGLTVETPPAPEPAAYDALLLCAPAYPEVTPLSAVARRALEQFLTAGKPVYLEYTPLEGVLGERVETAGFERLVVTGPQLARGGLAELAALEEHASRYLPFATLPAEATVLLRYAKVAGMDRAVFGLPAQTSPALVALPRGSGHLYLCGTALSNSLRGRYRPSRAWAALLREVLLALLPAAEAGAVRSRYLDLDAWTEPRQWAAPGQAVRLCVRTDQAATVQARGPDGPVALSPRGDLLVSAPLSLAPGRHELRVSARRGAATRVLQAAVEVSPREDRYREALRRNLRWFEQGAMLVSADGAQGVREGLSSCLGPDGRPTPAGGLRVDCVSECGLLFALYGTACRDQGWRRRGEQMLAYTGRAFSVTSRDCWYFGHWQSRGEFRDDGSTVYVFNDDSGAGTLFALLGYLQTGDARLLEAGLRGVEYFRHVASDRTGLFGSMPHRDYEGSGHLGVAWPALRAQQVDRAAPHVMNLPLASLLVAYRLTGEPRYLEVARRGLATLMAGYPGWHLVTSRTCEHGRMLLPLALLYAIEPTDEHRQWLDTVAGYLEGRQDRCGAIAEWDGYNPGSNEAFGTAENSVFQENGDPVSDQLYGTGFALLHLGLAYQVTGEPRLHEAYRRLGDYLTRIQLRDADPRYDGTWLRAFDYRRWEYFGSSADIGWGPYCSETGWMCAPIGLGLLLELKPDLLALPRQPLPGLLRQAQAARREADAVEAALSAPPAPVTGLRAEPSRGPYAALAWDNPPVPVLQYHVYRADRADFAPDARTLVGTASAGHWGELPLAPESDYYYRVVAANGLGQTAAPSAAVHVRTGPLSKARGCGYVKAPAPYASYSDPGDRASTDGVYAREYHDRKSYAYRLAEVGESTRVTVTVDLGKSVRIARATHHNCGAPGYRPDAMRVSLSSDGATWREVGETAEVSGELMVVGFAETEARWVRFEFRKQRTGANDDWLFLDELEVF